METYSQMAAIHLSSFILYAVLLSALLYAASRFLVSIYYTFYGPLSNIPGPKLNAFSIVPYIRAVWKGDEGRELIALHEKYGKIVRMGPNSISVIGNFQTWKEIYGFQKAGRQLPPKDYRFFGQPVNGVPSLIIADDATHGRQRKIASNAFSDKALKEQEPLLKTWANLMRIKLTEKAKSGEMVDMLKMLNCTTFDIMSTLSFGEPLYLLENSEYSPWVKAIFLSIKRNTILRCIKQYSEFTKALIETAIPMIPSLRAKQLQHWKYTTERVDRRLTKTPDQPDLWSRIIEKSQGPDGLSLAEQHSNAALFMLAGTETTATALSGILFYLAQNPDKMKTIKAEVNDVFDSFEDLHLESLARCKYMEAVLKEGLRMYPPVPIGLGRHAPKGGAVIDGHFLPEGTNISIPHLATYRMSWNWHNPFVFAPERWLGAPEYEKDNRDAWEPFSIGPRNCLGKVCYVPNGNARH